MASVERVVILLQGCIFDACGSYHKAREINDSKCKLQLIIIQLKKLFKWFTEYLQVIRNVSNVRKEEPTFLV